MITLTQGELDILICIAFGGGLLIGIFIMIMALKGRVG